MDPSSSSIGRSASEEIRVEGGMRIKRGESWKEKVNCDEGKDGVKIKGVAESGRLF